MKHRVSLILAALFVAVVGSHASAQSPQFFGFLPFIPVGAVYTMSNAADGNAVLIFDRVWCTSSTPAAIASLASR